MTITRTEALDDIERLVAHLAEQMPLLATELDSEAQDARPSAVLVPLFAGADGTPHLLFTERSREMTRHSGEISFPGGRQDPDDPSLLATALREAHEEIGLAPERAAIVGALPSVFTVVSNYLITPYLGLVQGPLEEIASAVNPLEVASVIDAPLAALAEPSIMHTQQWERRGQMVTVHFYQFGPHRIWGATGRILSHFLELLPAA
jgi:8-oxo-dGTP pyrophosphatase MutT (NUDIX family)